MVVVFAFVGESHTIKARRRRRKQSSVSRLVLFFSAKTDAKKTQKKIKILPLLTLLYSSANDNTIHINIKTVWRAWMNSKSPKAEETKGTEI